MSYTIIPMGPGVGQLLIEEEQRRCLGGVGQPPVAHSANLRTGKTMQVTMEVNMPRVEFQRLYKILLSILVGGAAFVLLMVLAGVAGIISGIGQVELLLILLASCGCGYLFYRRITKRVKSPS